MAEESISSSPRPKKHLSCLVIDDDLDDQEIFRMALERVDPKIRCLFANDGVRGLERLYVDASFIPDFIFVDINMPRINGFECINEIRKISWLKEVPVYVYSTSLNPAVIEQCRKLGAKDCVQKFAEINDLSGYLEKLLATLNAKQ
jgi:CheY-like chemotaxis protein